MKKKVIVILGPTAVGKTKLSIDIAKLYNCEIISADSMQIYKYMDIGTAKPSIDEQAGVKHYLIDQIYPNEEFSVALFKDLVNKYIKEIIRKDRIPLIVGGTGLYINSLLYNINYTDVVSDDEYRNELNQVANVNGNEYLHDMLKKVDPDSASKLHPNDTRRVIRALEVYKCTNKPISYHQKISRIQESEYEFIVIGLNMERSKLYDRINQRVDIMMNNGLLDEVKSLVLKGYNRELVSMKGIGYKEIIDYIDGRYDIDEAVDKIKQESRRYAKRQLTWFRRNNEIEWFDVTQVDYQIILKKVKEYIAQKMVIM